MAFGFDRFRSALGLALAIGLAAMTLRDPSLAWFAIPAAAGSLLVAGALFALHRSRRFQHLEDATDAPDSARLRVSDMSKVNPAGIGGLGLGAMAVFAALRYPQGQFLMVVGLAGGMLIAATMVKYRQTHTAKPVRILPRRF